MALNEIKNFKIKIQSENIPLSVKYEYLKSLNDILKTYEYSFFAFQHYFDMLKKNFYREVMAFNQKLNIVYDYLKDNGNFLNLKIDSFVYQWLMNNLGVLIFMEDDARVYDIVMELILEKNKNFPVFKIDKKYLSRLEELYNHLREYGNLPVQTDRTFKFKDGKYMGSFLAHNKRRIRMLKEGNEWAYALARYYEKRYLSFEDKLNEVYNLILNENLSSNSKFSNGEIIKYWLWHSKSKLILMNDDKAIEIIRYLNQKKLGFEDKVNELYDYLILNGSIPSYSSLCAFSDGSLMGRFVYENKDKMTSEKERYILDYVRNRKMSDEDKLNEVYNYLLKNGDLPSKSNNQINFSDGSHMGYWIYSHYDMILNNDDYPKVIREYLTKKNLSYEDKLNEVYKYLLENANLPNDDIRFSNGQIMKGWIDRNKLKISLMDNDMAIYITDYLNSLKRLTFDEKVDELYNRLLDDDFVLTSDTLFSDGVSVKGWLKDNKDRIKNLDDLFIFKRCFKLSFEEKIEEAYKYLCLYKRIPFQSESVKFSDGSYMGMWFSNNKRKIYYMDGIDLFKEKILEVNPKYFDLIKMKEYSKNVKK